MESLFLTSFWPSSPQFLFSSTSLNRPCCRLPRAWHASGASERPHHAAATHFYLACSDITPFTSGKLMRRKPLRLPTPKALSCRFCATLKGRSSKLSSSSRRRRATSARAGCSPRSCAVGLGRALSSFSKPSHCSWMILQPWRQIAMIHKQASLHKNYGFQKT